MEKETLVHIQDTAVFDQVVQQLKSATSERPDIVLPNSMKVDSLEQFMPLAKRFRFCMSTTFIDDFTNYTVEKGSQESICLIDTVDPQDMSALAIIDLGDDAEPLHKSHQAVLHLQPLYDYRLLMNSVNREYSQKELADWVIDNKHLILIFDSMGDSMTAEQAAAVFKEMTIESAKSMASVVGDYSDALSISEKIEAQNAPKLPAAIVFKCTPYTSFQAHEFQIRVSLSLNGDRPKIKLRDVDLERQQEQIALEFASILRTKLDAAGVPCYMGKA